MTDSSVERLGNMHVDDATLSEAQDLITALSAENERLNHRIEELEDKIDRTGQRQSNNNVNHPSLLPSL